MPWVDCPGCGKSGAAWEDSQNSSFCGECEKKYRESEIARTENQMSDRLTIEKVYKIWDDETGDHLYVGPDGDGLDLIEFRDVAKDGQISNRFTMTKAQFERILKIGPDLLKED
ncbi:MAG: hypothetical protein LUQ37_04535 [Methanoregulaceae archaeon]|jgi:hypothetical protein|nr:hypothetical protein [Methanoregulaceae archaeon]